MLWTTRNAVKQVYNKSAASAPKRHLSASRTNLFDKSSTIYFH